MPVFRLPEEPLFPPPSLAEPSGLLAVGGDLSAERLVAAYASGIFPWFSEDGPILWHSPDPRAVLPLDGLHVSRSLRKSRRRFEITFDRAFDAVIHACATTARPGQPGTWITRSMEDAYRELHRLGLAHSVEVWQGGALEGGLYGVCLGRAFFGESMFHRRRDASKVALWALVDHLRAHDFQLLDCQVETPHLRRLGAILLPRDRFLEALERAIAEPTVPGTWPRSGQWRAPGGGSGSSPSQPK